MWSRIMRVEINGQWQQFDQAPTVAELLEARNLPAKRVAVELNRRILPRGMHAQTLLKDNDAIEIVTLVGGG
jgi:sulfur carrier protein